MSSSQATTQGRVEGPRLPTLKDLNRATRVTADVLLDPEATLADLDRATHAEAATLHAYWHRPSAQAHLEREPEAG
jgi:hypothetical protein